MHTERRASVRRSLGLLCIGAAAIWATACAHATGGSGGAPSRPTAATLPPIGTAASRLPVDSAGDHDLVAERASEVTVQAKLDSMERTARELDARGAPAEARVQAHLQLVQRYRGLDYDDGMETHAAAIVRLVPDLSAADRAKLASELIMTEQARAEVAADRGDAPRALAILRNAPTELPGVPGVATGVAPSIARYDLVGKPAPALVADYWVKGPSGSDALQFTPGGPVTIVEMTAWWCGSCHRTYPWLRSIVRRYGDSVRVVLVTNLMRTFHSDTGLTPAVEREKLTNYFMTEKQLTAALAISSTAFGDSTDVPTRAYHVYGIPQVAFIGRDGVMHRLVEGWDPHNEAMFDAAVAALVHPDMHTNAQ